MTCWQAQIETELGLWRPASKHRFFCCQVRDWQRRLEDWDGLERVTCWKTQTHHSFKITLERYHLNSIHYEPIKDLFFFFLYTYCGRKHLRQKIKGVACLLSETKLKKGKMSEENLEMKVGSEQKKKKNNWISQVFPSCIPADAAHPVS